MLPHPVHERRGNPSLQPTAPAGTQRPRRADSNRIRRGGEGDHVMHLSPRHVAQLLRAETRRLRHGDARLLRHHEDQTILQVNPPGVSDSEEKAVQRQRESLLIAHHDGRPPRGAAARGDTPSLRGEERLQRAQQRLQAAVTRTQPLPAFRRNLDGELRRKPPGEVRRAILRKGCPQLRHVGLERLRRRPQHPHQLRRADASPYPPAVTMAAIRPIARIMPAVLLHDRLEEQHLARFRRESVKLR